jgi:pimeloyl-ACP methyl ester carboxylesterase
VFLPGVGHVSNLEAPEAFDAEVRRFLRAVSARGAVEDRTQS